MLSARRVRLETPLYIDREGQIKKNIQVNNYDYIWA